PSLDSQWWKLPRPTCPLLLYMNAFISCLQLSYDTCSCFFKLGESILTSGFIHRRTQIRNHGDCKPFLQRLLRCGQHAMVVGNTCPLYLRATIIFEPLPQECRVIRCRMALESRIPRSIVTLAEILPNLR